jgi:hypothetical protein
MTSKANDRRKIAYLALAVIITWIGLGMQFYLYLDWAFRHQLGVPGAVWNFLSYFTNLANLLAGITLLYSLSYACGLKRPSIDARKITSHAVYVCMAGIVFNLELRHLVPPGALVQLTNVILHDISPVLFLAYWWLYGPHAKLSFRNAHTCLAFPTLYFFCTLAIGHFTRHYPYPFFDVTKVGYLSVFKSGLELLAGFMVTSLSLVALNAFKEKRLRAS